MVEWLTRAEGPRVRTSPALLRRGACARHIYPSLVLVQPRKTRPCLTESLLMGRKESNQQNKSILASIHSVFYVIFHAFHQVIQKYIYTSNIEHVGFISILCWTLAITAKLWTSLYCFDVVDVLFNIFYTHYFSSESPCRSSLKTIVICSILKCIHIWTTLPVTSLCCISVYSRFSGSLFIFFQYKMR